MVRRELGCRATPGAAACPLARRSSAPGYAATRRNAVRGTVVA